MGKDNLIFLEVLEWFDDTGKELVHRIPETGSGEIKFGAQMTVRESQAGVFFYQGKAVEAFGPGRHTLKTLNIPVLTKIASIPWGLSSPLRAEAYFVNLKIFTNLKWGTRDPVAFRDSELGLIRLRAFGVFNVQVVQPILFINSLVGTQGNSITPPAEVQKAIDDRTRMGVFKDMNKLMQMKAAMAMEKASEGEAGAGQGMGMGMGLMMPAMFSQYFAGAKPGAQEGGAAETVDCPDCRNPVPVSAKFCPHCGHQQVVFQRCTECGKNLSSSAKFCSRCGHPAEDKPKPRFCSKCGSENLTESLFCNQCGEKL
jgi:membrane protease subunit (stomatin/prohibitin family)